MTDLARYSNPWTVQICDSSGHWHNFTHDAPITLTVAEERIRELQVEHPNAKFRAFPWFNSSQTQVIKEFK